MKIKDYWNQVIELGPHPKIASHAGERTIHHVHGGSIKDAGIHVGMGQKNNDWLVVCLPQSLHTGKNGIDYGYGVRSWERDFISQLELLSWTAEQTGVDVFNKAGLKNE